jgi:hypothetical protein
MADWYMLGNKWYNGEGGYSETDPNKPALPHAQYEGWAQGADFSNGMNSYRGPDGKQYIYNNSQYMNGPKLFSYDGSPVPQAILDQIRAQVPDVQIGSDAMMREFLLDPMGPGSAGRDGGSDLSNILKTLSVPFAGSSIASLLGAPGMTAMQTLSSALPSIPNPFSGIDKPWGVNPQSFIGDELLPPTDMSFQPSFIGDELIPPTGSELSNFYKSPAYLDMIKAGGAAAGAAGAATQAPAPVQDMSRDYVPGQNGAPANGAVGPNTALGRILASMGITGLSSDLLSVLGNAAPGLLGAYASSRQTDAMKTMSDQFAGYGAPYRQRLADLYADPSKFLSSPDVQKPVQMGSDIMARSLSVQGNPTGSGNALQQLQSYSADQLFGRLGQEKDRLGGFGGLTAYNSAAPSAASNAIGANANVANSLGAAANNVFNPPKTLAQQLQEFKTLSGVMG